MRLFVLHDQERNVLSVMRVDSLPDDMDQPYGNLRDGEAVLEVESTSTLEALLPHEIMEQYMLDERMKKLKRKD